MADARHGNSSSRRATTDSHRHQHNTGRATGSHRHQDNTGHAHRHQDNTEHAHRHQDNTGHTHRHQDNTEHAHRHQEGHTHRHQDNTEHAHRHQDNTGHAHRHQDNTGHTHRHQEGHTHRHQDNTGHTHRHHGNTGHTHHHQDNTGHAHRHHGNTGHTHRHQDNTGHAHRHHGSTGHATGSHHHQDNTATQRSTGSQRSTSSQRSSGSTASQRSSVGSVSSSSSQRSTGSSRQDNTASEHSVRGTTILSNAQLEAIIKKTLSFTAAEFAMHVSVDDLVQLCNTVTTVLRGQPALIETAPPIFVCGNIHGQFQDLKRIFETIGHPPVKRYMFLGDFVDRGTQSIETAVLLMAYKARYPDKFFILRGSHECGSINRIYGFYEEIERRYGRQNVRLLWKHFNDAFAWLPYAGRVGTKILCMHGGISLQVTSVQRLRDLRRPFVDPPNPSLELDLLWADPDPDITGVRPNLRGVSILFGRDVLTMLCNRLNISLVIRAHQCVPYGAQFFGNNQMLTVFSAPNYDGQNNVGAVLQIEGQPPRCSFRFFN